MQKKPSLIILMLMLAFVTTVVQAASQTIDAFQTGAQDLAASSALPVNSGTVDDVAILGGERDMVVTYDSGTSDVTGRVDFNNNNLFEVTVGNSTYGNVQLVWDGNDSDPLSLNPIGLGGVDLVDATNDGVLFTVNSWDGRSVDINLVIYTDANNYSEATLKLRGESFANRDIALSFADSFVQGSGATGPASFTSVGAVVLTVVAVQDSPDLSLSLAFADPSRDFGDLPATYNLTTEGADNGARHTLGNVYLGTTIDAELDGQESIDATGDGADEDGVVRSGTWSEGVDGGQVDVTYTAPGAFKSACLEGWIDWGEDGSFSEVGDHVVVQQNMLLGTSTIQFAVPAGVLTGGGSFNARWRIYPDTGSVTVCSDEPAISESGLFINGEVEDYQWGFSPSAISLGSLSAADSTASMPLALLAVLALTVVGTGMLIFRRQRVH